MAQFQAVDVSSLAQQLDLLGRIKRRNRDREAAEKTNRLRNVFTIGGAVVGCVGTGTPSGALLGAQVGSTVGGLAAERRGGQPVSNRELLATGLSAAVTAQQIQNQQKIDTQNTQTNAAFAQSISTEGMTEDQRQQFSNFVANEENLTSDPQRFRQGVFNINPDLAKPQITEGEGGQRFIRFFDVEGQRTQLLPETTAQRKTASLAESAEVIRGTGTGLGITFTDEQLATREGQATALVTIEKKKKETAKIERAAIATGRKEEIAAKATSDRLVTASALLSSLPEDSPTRQSLQSSVEAGEITPSDLVGLQASAAKEKNLNTNTAVAQTFGLELTPNQLELEPRQFNAVVKTKLREKDKATSTQEQTDNNKVFGDLMSTNIGDPKLKEEISKIPTDQKSSVYQGKVGLITDKHVKNIVDKVKKEKDVTKRAALAEAALSELIELSPNQARLMQRELTSLINTRDKKIVAAEKEGKEFNKVLLREEAIANASKTRTPLGDIPFTKSEKAESIATGIEPHIRLGSTSEQRQKFAAEFSRQKTISLTNAQEDIKNERTQSDARITDNEQGQKVKLNNEAREIRKTKNLVSQMDQALANPNITDADKKQIEQTRTNIIDDFTDGVINEIAKTLTEEQANNVVAVRTQQLQGLLDEERINQALDDKITQRPLPTQKPGKRAGGIAPLAEVQQDAPETPFRTTPAKRDILKETLGEVGEFLTGPVIQPAGGITGLIGEQIADIQTNLTAPTDIPPVTTSNLAATQNTPPVTLTSSVRGSGNISLASIATTVESDELASRVRAEVPEINVSSKKIDSLSLKKRIELVRLMDDPIKNEAAIKKLLDIPFTDQNQRKKKLF